MQCETFTDFEKSLFIIYFTFIFENTASYKKKALNTMKMPNTSCIVEKKVYSFHLIEKKHKATVMQKMFLICRFQAQVRCSIIPSYESS